MYLNKAAVATAKKVQKKDSKAAKWIASDALRELTSKKVLEQTREKRRQYLMRKCQSSSRSNLHMSFDVIDQLKLNSNFDTVLCGRLVRNFCPFPEQASQQFP